MRGEIEMQSINCDLLLSCWRAKDELYKNVENRRNKAMRLPQLPLRTFPEFHETSRLIKLYQPSLKVTIYWWNIHFASLSLTAQRNYWGRQPVKL